MFDKFLKAKKPIDSSNQSNQIYSLDPIGQLIVNFISDSVIVINSNNVITLFNPAAESLTGWKADNAINLDFRSVLSMLDINEQAIKDSENPVLSTLRQGKPLINYHLKLETLAKRKILVSLNVIPIKSNNDSIAGATITLRDISIEQANANSQTEFISTASHEMRTPVATIEGYLGMILNPKLSAIDDRAKSYAEKAYAATKHLGRLFQDLLDVTRSDDNLIKNEPTLIDAKATARMVVENFQAKAKEKGLGLYFDDTPNNLKGNLKVISPIIMLFVDFDHLCVILNNLVENAIKYTKTGAIKLKVSANNRRVRFEVIDTGIGIPNEDIPHLFQKFYRIDSSDTREIGGTGLGLYLIKRLATNMGGVVGVNSIYGKGSDFWVEFDEIDRNDAVSIARELKSKNSTRL